MKAISEFWYAISNIKIYTFFVAYPYTSAARTN